MATPRLVGAAKSGRQVAPCITKEASGAVKRMTTRGLGMAPRVARSMPPISAAERCRRRESHRWTATSVAVTLASLTVTPPAPAEMLIDCPLTVGTAPVLTSFAITLPETT